jgi:UDP-GlcNAc3NAcA epimerase
LEVQAPDYMKILTILGARPQFIKAATVSRIIKESNAAERSFIHEVILHTGQHYDTNMSDIFFEEMDIPRPDYRLDCGRLGHGAMTGRMLEEIEEILEKEKPDWVLVYGDTNSTLAGALAAAKMHIQVAHVEAGLRSFNMAMPEEINRILVDRISNSLFCPTETAVKNLEQEGFPFPTKRKSKQEILNVGDVMYDATLFYQKKAKETVSLEQWGLDENGYALCTIHRAENTDDQNCLESIFQALRKISKIMPIILPLHPRTKKIVSQSSFADLLSTLKVIDPVSYIEIQRLVMGAKLILTDSGGIQKEAFFHKVPCFTLRDETEWVETVESGWNRITGTSETDILDSFENYSIPEKHLNFYGDGQSASKILQTLLNEY